MPTTNPRIALMLTEGLSRAIERLEQLPARAEEDDAHLAELRSELAERTAPAETPAHSDTEPAVTVVFIRESDMSNTRQRKDFKSAAAADAWTGKNDGRITVVERRDYES